MTTRSMLLVSLLGACSVVLGSLLAPATHAQEGVEEERVDVEGAIEALENSLGAPYPGAMLGAIARAERAFRGTDDETARRRIIGTLGRFLTFRSEERLPVAVEAARVLGSMGPDAATLIVRALRDPRLEDEDRLQPLFLELIRSLGRTGDVNETPRLVEYLDHRDPAVAVAAIDALSHYRFADQRVRKFITEELIKAIEASMSLAPARSRAPGAYPKQDFERYRRLLPPANRALQRITGAREDEIEAWRDWFNENKDRRWKELSPGENR
jgi:hypothetical protein